MFSGLISVRTRQRRVVLAESERMSQIGYIGEREKEVPTDDENSESIDRTNLSK